MQYKSTVSSSKDNIYVRGLQSTHSFGPQLSFTRGCVQPHVSQPQPKHGAPIFTSLHKSRQVCNLVAQSLIVAGEKNKN